MADVVVYGRSDCIQCGYTTKELDKLGIEYVYVDIDEDGEAREAVAETGISSLPVVVAAQQVWGGFSPDKIRSLRSGT